MYYIIDPKCANKVYDNEDFEIDLLELLSYYSDNSDKY